MGWNNIVKEATLEDPVNVGIFHNDGFGRREAMEAAKVFCNNLDAAGIKFAAVDQCPPIYVKIEKKDLSKVKEKKVEGGGIVDIR